MNTFCLRSAIASALVLSGCVTETVKSPPAVPHGEMRATTRSANGNLITEKPPVEPVAPALPAPDVKSPDPNSITNSDPCAANLQNLSGALLTFFAANQKLPDQLSELAKFSDVDAPFDLRCPLSKLPYVYNRDGLSANGKTKVIIVYDAAASHAGVRWCILMSPPKRVANRSLEVVAIPESTFRLYH